MSRAAIIERIVRTQDGSRLATLIVGKARSAASIPQGFEAREGQHVAVREVAPGKVEIIT